MRKKIKALNLNRETLHQVTGGEDNDLPPFPTKNDTCTCPISYGWTCDRCVAV
jgi:hypothetical protein